MTPSGVSLTAGSCGNYGTQSAQVDPRRPADVYTQFMCQGVWKSTDHGRTWRGPVNTGSNGDIAGDCAGGIVLARGATAAAPTLYQSCIRGRGTGFWRSQDGGVNWTRFVVAPGGDRQDFYPPAIDPYDGDHLVMAGHEMNLLVESFDGGRTWIRASLDASMQEDGGSASVDFIDTGDPVATRTTWLWFAQITGGTVGTWRTSDGGRRWKRVDSNEHLHGGAQIYQPGPGPVVFMAGAYSEAGWGVLRSSDFGQTWTHEGTRHVETIVFGTSKFVYSMHGWPVGPGQPVGAELQIAPQPGDGAWMEHMTPAAMLQAPAHAAVTNDGVHNVIVTANWNAGLWRYVEP